MAHPQGNGPFWTNSKSPGYRKGQCPPAPCSPHPPSRFSALPPVTNLTVKAWTTSSITLRWEAPSGLDQQNYTYWVRWTGQSDKTETRNTTDTIFTAEGLDPGSSYEFSVWVEKDGANSSEETLNATTGEKQPPFHSFSFLSFFFLFLEPYLGHMAFSRLGVQSELNLPAYSTATATPDQSPICDLHHSSQPAERGQGSNPRT